MKSFNIILLILTLSIFTLISVNSQVIVHLRQPPPFKFEISDLWKVKLTNTSQTTYTVYLYGTASKSDAGLIVEGTTKTFSLPPGTKVVTPVDISPIDVKEPNSSYENVIKQTGTVPNGDYEICIRVMNSANNILLGSECIDQSVQSVTQTALITPLDEETITDRFPVFSWLPPAPVRSSQNVRYTLSIVEILGIQSGYDAMQSNPEFHQSENLAGNVYQYPAVSKQFKSGRRYAWQVMAFLDGFYLCKSDVREFKYGNILDTSVMVSENKKKIKQTGSGSLKLHELLAASENPFLQKKRQGLILFSGSSDLYGESANRTATFSNEPQRFADWNINPNLSILGIPFNMNILLSTKQNTTADKQNINSISFGFDPSKLKDIVEEKVRNFIESKRQEIEQKIKQKGEQFREKIESDVKDSYTKRLSLPMKIFSSINTLGIGVTYPSFSKYTLNGVPVTGLNLEFNPGLFYINIAGAKNKKPVDNVSFKRSLYAGKIGVGQKDNTHMYFTLLYAKDDENSIKDTNYALTPAANYIIGTDAKVSMFKKKIQIEGEAAVSLFTSDITAPDIVSSAIPSWIRNIFKPKNTSSFDGFYSGKISFDNARSNTKTYFKILMLGPGYRSLGSSSTQNDMFKFEFKLDQKFLNNKISASLQLSNDHDNLLNIIKPFRSTTTNGILNLTFAFPKLPRVTILYIPSFRSNNSSSETDKVDEKIHNVMLVSSYVLKIGNNTCISQLNAGISDNSTYRSENDGYSKNISLTESIIFQIPLSLTGRAGLSQTLDKLFGYSRILSGEFTASYTMEKFWTVSSGGGIDITKEQNKRTVFFFSSDILFGKNLTLNIRAEKNNYTDWKSISNDFDEFVIKSTLSANW